MAKPKKEVDAPRKATRPIRARREREESFDFLELFEDCALTDDEHEAFKFVGRVR
jgi:hypothetical protein